MARALCQWVHQAHRSTMLVDPHASWSVFVIPFPLVASLVQCVIEKVKGGVWTHASILLPPLFEKLGDGKTVVRQVVHLIQYHPHSRFLWYCTSPPCPTL
jgi:hypothetical protein